MRAKITRLWCSKKTLSRTAGTQRVRGTLASYMCACRFSSCNNEVLHTYIHPQLAQTEEMMMIFIVWYDLIINSNFIEFQFKSGMHYITVYDGMHSHMISNMTHGILKHEIFGKGNRLLVSLHFNDSIQLYAKVEFKVCK